MFFKTIEKNVYNQAFHNFLKIVIFIYYIDTYKIF